tara:strand:- start:110 stop:994 length:885 start_codon:yes stop_codon:yes gene_type:complete
MSSFNQITNANLFNPSDIKYDNIKTGNNNNKTINIKNKSTGSPIQLRTALMLTWGISDYEGNEKYEMSLQFPSEEYRSEKQQAFLDNMIAYENKIKDDAIANSKAWFGKEIKSKEVIDAMWTPMLKYPKNKITGEPDYDRAPSLRVKVPFWEGEWKMALFNMDKQKIFPDPSSDVTPKDLVQKGAQTAAVFRSGGIWVVNNRFGTTWRLDQAVVKPKESVNDSCQIDLDPEDKKTLQQQVIESDDDEEAGVKSAFVESEDEGEEEEEEQERAPTPPPEPVKKKKVVKKKAVASA